jgi:hypothetical protein
MAAGIAIIVRLDVTNYVDLTGHVGDSPESFIRRSICACWRVANISD